MASFAARGAVRSRRAFRFLPAQVPAEPWCSRRPHAGTWLSAAARKPRGAVYPNAVSRCRAAPVPRCALLGPRRPAPPSIGAGADRESWVRSSAEAAPRAHRRARAPAPAARTPQADSSRCPSHSQQEHCRVVSLTLLRCRTRELDASSPSCLLWFVRIEALRFPHSFICYPARGPMAPSSAVRELSVLKSRAVPARAARARSCRRRALGARSGARVPA